MRFRQVARAISRKLLATLLASVVAIQMSAVPASAAYAYSCSSGTQSTAWSMFERNTTGWPGPDFTGVLSNVKTRDQRPCGSPNSSKYDYPLLLGANIQGPVYPYHIVQLGYVECGAAVNCNDIPNDGKPHFVYTPNDAAEGAIYLFDTYYKAPVAGNTYRMKIYLVTSTNPDRWYYCIRDLTAGESTYDCEFRTSTWGNGKVVWWGSETQNTNSQQGGTPGGTATYKDLEYRRGGAWSIVTDQDSCVYPGQHPSYYVCYPADTTYNNDTLVNYTTDH